MKGAEGAERITDLDERNAEGRACTPAEKGVAKIDGVGAMIDECLASMEGAERITELDEAKLRVELALTPKRVQSAMKDGYIFW